MLNIKFFVLVIYFSDIIAYRAKYCKICSNHTLCKYESPGPSQQCVGYDKDAILTEDDTKAILDKINERRNFIALGRLKFLPTAANMKKLVWSEELAMFAQRWVDQCDQHVTPDKTDQCRNLENLEVGQNIATITGYSKLTPRYNVKSFVEMWFMQSMDYTGSVTYYNQSQDGKTNYFTQLIWANTQKVGCGKAKFYIKNLKPILIERLVCNFASKANLRGQPVYTIGYPATQCGDGMNRDSSYPGLCSYGPELKGNMKDAVKRSYQLIDDDFWRSQVLNGSRYYGDNLQKHDRGHSRVYHGHSHRYEFDSLHTETVNEDVRKYDYTTAGHILNKEQNNKKDIERQCTRKSEFKLNSFDSSNCRSCNEKSKKCTRNTKDNNRQKNDYQITTNRCVGCYFRSTLRPNPREFFACNTHLNYLINTNQCAQNSVCDCLHINYSTRSCPYLLRSQRDMDIKLEKRNDFQYYNTDPYITQEPKNKAVSKILSGTRKVPSNNNNGQPHKIGLKILHNQREINRNHSERKKRMTEENKKSFWQMDEYINKNHPQLKSIKYTTLSQRKSAKYKQTRKNSKLAAETESITVAYNKNRLYKNGKRITEKYLSFDELMYLRKHNIEDLSARRHNDDKEILRESNLAGTQITSKSVEPSQSTLAAETTEYTFNTPYIRMKYCTRKLTCTWTAASLTDSAGSIIPGGPGGVVGGSRTPPGYVEGCTRTSTCTRDYMNRNKMATLTIETTSPEPVSSEDEDYCERRSLNRRSNNNKSNSRSQNETPIFIMFPNNNIVTLNESESSTSRGCDCNDENFRMKRDNYDYRKINFTKIKKREYKNNISLQNNLLSYVDLYYYVVRKIIKMWANSSHSYTRVECLCNGVKKIMCCYLFIVFIIFLQYI